MKAKWLKDVKELIGRQEFFDWWNGFLSCRKELEDNCARIEEAEVQRMLLASRSDFVQKRAIEALYRSGEMEDEATAMSAESSDLENRAFEAVGEFENQRLLVSDLWSKLGAHELSLEKKKAEMDEVKRTSGGKSGTAAAIELRRVSSELDKIQKEYDRVSAEYETEAARKGRTWEAVEELWRRSIARSLRMNEKKMKGRRVRREAEARFKEAEQLKKRAEEMKLQQDELAKRREDLSAEFAALHARAVEKFDCEFSEDFLYWPQKENNRMVYCVPTFDDDQSYNIEIKSLCIYQVDRLRGVEFLEPVIPEIAPADGQDRRVDEFFVK